MSRFNPPEPPKPLANARHEAYALARVQGQDPWAARASAGYPPTGFPSASELEFEPEVVARVAVLGEQMARKRKALSPSEDDV